jgi:hypothetical protein
MKYKINYKANDKANDSKSIIEFLEDKGYSYNGSTGDHLILYFKKRKDYKKVVLEVNVIKKFVYKFELVNTNIGAQPFNVPFTKEELKFFDLLDYEIVPVYGSKDNAVQTVTDWVGM